MHNRKQSPQGGYNQIEKETLLNNNQLIINSSITGAEGDKEDFAEV